MDKKPKNQESAKKVVMRSINATEHAAPVDVVAMGAAVSTLIQQINDGLAVVPGLVTLNADEKRRIAKPRPGAERHADEMAIAAEEFPQFVAAGFNAEAMAQSLLYVQTLRSLLVALSGAVKTVDDTLFAMTAGVWSSALDVYAALQRQAQKHPEIGPAIAGMTAYLARNPVPAVPAPATDNGNGNGTTDPVLPPPSTPTTPVVNG